MRFASPVAFFALLVLPVLVFYVMKRDHTAQITFSAVASFRKCGSSLRQRVFYLPLVLRCLVLLLLAVGLARPQQGLEKVIDVSKGIAIEMVVDRSGSMGAEMDFSGERLTRLDVVKKVFGEFVQGNGKDLSGRPNDLIGIITFAGFADTICPLTLGHGALSQFLDNIHLVPRNSPENRTAIGDAVALAAARLKTAEETLARQNKKSEDQYEIKSKIIILLTDGENNAGEYAPAEAATLAKEWGIKIYTIGIGGGEAVKVQTLFGTRTIRTGAEVDQKMLTTIAENTGGSFYLAEDAEGLRAIYKEIDEMEKSEVESITFMDYRELFSRFAIVALGLLIFEIVLQTTAVQENPMSDIQIHSLKMLYLLWMLPFLLALYIYAGQCRRKGMEKFLSRAMSDRLAKPVSRVRRGWKIFFLLTACMFIIAGLSRPAWNKKEMVVKHSGRDVVFLLDVSRSMMAEDLLPNRLEHAKLAILDTVEKLQGDRVALVAFAGNAVVKCPLTVDYGFFRLILEDIGLDAVSRGGTLLGDAVRTVLQEVFDNQARQYRDIILITDGEDHESFPVEAARAAGEKGIRMIVIGLGDEREGRRIPVVDETGNKSFLKYQGKEVWTKLDGETLRRMAGSTPGGQYLPVATGTINLGQVYMDLVASAEKKQLESKTIRNYEEKFQIFLAAAFLLLCLEALISERTPFRKGDIS